MESPASPIHRNEREELRYHAVSSSSDGLVHSALQYRGTYGGDGGRLVIREWATAQVTLCGEPRTALHHGIGDWCPFCRDIHMCAISPSEV